MIKDVLVFTPIYRLEPETVEAIFALEWDGPISYLFQRDNPLQPTEKRDERVTGVLNHFHQYERGREVFLEGRYDAMLIVESDIIPPPDALLRLAALDSDIALGVYVFRVHPVVNLFEKYRDHPTRGRARNIGESLSVRHLWPPKRPGPLEVSGAGFGCTLIKRHVVEAIPFRILSENMEPRVHCDSWFTQDAWQGGYTFMADTRVLCGHKKEDGEILWPPS